jgi:hypothetical protein
MAYAWVLGACGFQIGSHLVAVTYVATGSW